MPSSRPGIELDYQRIFESAPGLYLVLSPELTILAATDTYLAATMTSRDDIVGRPLFEVFPDNPADPAADGVSNLRASLARVLSQQVPDAMAVQKYDVRRPAAEGGGYEERYWSPVNSPVFDADGRLACIVHRVEDVTEFVRLRRQEREREHANDALRSQAGQMEAEIVRRGRELQDANRRLRELHAALERRVEAQTGDLHRVEEALHRSEEQLRQAQKLEAIGRLAGGVAHDFNNLLSVILGYGETIRSELPSRDPLRGDLDEILKAGTRAAELTRQLLAFSRQQVLDFKVLDLNEVLAGLNPMLTRLLGEDIELRLALKPGLWPVRADRGQIEQVVMNLAVNARDAMPNGGKLTLETANVELDEDYARDHLDVVPGPHVMLAVSDTGQGMERDTQARVFEPFFTTKERGKGTGLGLSTVFGIVKQSSGSIWVYSELGNGTTFKIYLPMTAGAPEVAREPAAQAPVGRETILLVEDEDQVRTVATSILTKAGYHVLSAGNPGEALLLAERHPARIDLFLTDVVMPKMNGREIAHRVTAIRPDIKVLYMSGYTDDVILHHGVLDSGVNFVEKPLTPRTLRQRVRDVLDGSRS